MFMYCTTSASSLSTSCPLQAIINTSPNSSCAKCCQSSMHSYWEERWFSWTDHFSSVYLLLPYLCLKAVFKLVAQSPQMMINGTPLPASKSELCGIFHPFSIHFSASQLQIFGLHMISNCVFKNLNMLITYESMFWKCWFTFKSFQCEIWYSNWVVRYVSKILANISGLACTSLQWWQWATKKMASTSNSLSCSTLLILSFVSLQCQLLLYSLCHLFHLQPLVQGDCSL